MFGEKMKAIEFIVLLAVIILATWIFGTWGFIGGIVVVILVATGKLKTGLEDKKKK
jgi:predicted PurR-regulated permease PerM